MHFHRNPLALCIAFRIRARDAVNRQQRAVLECIIRNIVDRCRKIDALQVDTVCKRLAFDAYQAAAGCIERAQALIVRKCLFANIGYGRLHDIVNPVLTIRNFDIGVARPARIIAVCFSLHDKLIPLIRLYQVAIQCKAARGSVSSPLPQVGSRFIFRIIRFTHQFFDIVGVAGCIAYPRPRKANRLSRFVIPCSRWRRNNRSLQAAIFRNVNVHICRPFGICVRIACFYNKLIPVSANNIAAAQRIAG